MVSILGLMRRVLIGSRRCSGVRLFDSDNCSGLLTEYRLRPHKATRNRTAALLVWIKVGLDLPSIRREVTNVFTEFVHILTSVFERRSFRLRNYFALVASPRPALELDRERDADVGPFDVLNVLVMCILSCAVDGLWFYLSSAY